MTRSASSELKRHTDGIPLGKVSYTHFLVLSETDVKFGGPPGVKQRIAPLWLHVICPPGERLEHGFIVDKRYILNKEAQESLRSETLNLT